MGFIDIFKGKQYKAELEDLQQKHEDLQMLMTPEMQDAFALQNKVRELEKEIANQNDQISELQKEISKRETNINKLDQTISEKKSEIIWLDDEILVQEFGLYQPQFDFANSLDYKEKLAEVRARQKDLIKDKKAVSGATNWTVNGNASQGKKMVSDTQKLLLRAFNSECDELVSKVKYTNFDASLNKIRKSAEAISKLGTTMDIAITKKYLDLKVKELRLAFEYQQKKQEEKEEQKAARAEMREAARLQKEIEAQRKKIEKEQTHYQTAYEKLLRQLEEDPDNIDLLAKKSELENQLTDIDKAIKDIDYREANHSKLGTTMDIAITKKYLDLKVKELRLAFEYQQKKQEEKEEKKAAREEMREAARLPKEIEAQRKKIEKEQTHYQTAYEKLLRQLEEDPDNIDLLAKKSELENQLTDIDKAIKDIDYREANQRAGYVYIISNIGAFGENVFKIGMTRRLDPQDRVDELGDASVPFNFDVHAMIFSDDAPALEAALHKAFEDRKLNMVNTRREFFNVTLDEIKEVVKKNFDKTVEFIDVPDAEQFRVSQKMKQAQ